MTFYEAEIFAIPHIAMKMGFYLAPLIVLILLGIALSRIFVQTKELKLSSVFVVNGLFSGISFVGMQTLFLEKITVISGRPSLALVLMITLFLLTSAVACFLIDSFKLSRPGLTLRWILLVLVGSSMIAYVLIDTFSARNLTGIEFIWLSSAALFVPAVSGGIAFGAFFQIVAERLSRMIFLALLATATGALVGAYHTKAIALDLGFSVAFSMMLLLCVGMALLTPTESSPDENPSI